MNIYASRESRYRLIVPGETEDVGRTAALMVVQQLHDKPGLAIALPTGRTPLTMYRWLVRFYREGTVSLTAAKAFNLDEYYGLAPDDAASFAAYLRGQFLDHVDLNPANINLLTAGATSPVAEGRRYEERIALAGGIDLAILGIGENGHIAFNEPGSAFDSRTRLVQLTDQTITRIRSSFLAGTAVPRLAMTMGIGTIMEARRIILLATGANKASILTKALQGPITTAVPASALQLHAQVTVIADREAAAALYHRSRNNHS